MTFPYLYIFLLYSSPLPSHLPISPIHFSFLASSPSIFEPFYLDTVSSLLCVYEYSNNVMWKTAACNIYHLLRVLTLFFFLPFLILPDSWRNWHRCHIYDWTFNHHLFAALWSVMSLCSYYDLRQKEVSLIRAESS